MSIYYKVKEHLVITRKADGDVAEEMNRTMGIKSCLDKCRSATNQRELSRVMQAFFTLNFPKSRNNTT